jgi:hypothetical protein
VFTMLEFSVKTLKGRSSSIRIFWVCYVMLLSHTNVCLICSVLEEKKILTRVYLFIYFQL